jgi:hypothetical protein
MTTRHWIKRHDGTVGPQRHWYFLTITECQLCGKTTVDRERRYGSRPGDLHRRKYVQTACSEHFI